MGNEDMDKGPRIMPVFFLLTTLQKRDSAKPNEVVN